MKCYLHSVLFVAFALTQLAADPLAAREPPVGLSAKRSSVLEVDLKTGDARTVSERLDNGLALLDKQDDVLLGVEFGGRRARQMVGISTTSGRVLWSFWTDDDTWVHLLRKRMGGFPHDLRRVRYPLDVGDVEAPIIAPGKPFCGLSEDRLVGIETATGKALWELAPPVHYSNVTAWDSIDGLRRHIVAVTHGRVRILDRADGRVVFDLEPESIKKPYTIDPPCESEQYVVLTLRQANDKTLLRINKRSGEVEQRVDPGRNFYQILAATDDLVVAYRGDGVVGLDIENLDHLVWRDDTRKLSVYGPRPLLWRRLLVTRGPDLPVVDLRDGSSFALFRQASERRPIAFPDQPWAIHDDTLYTVSAEGIVAWDAKQLESRGAAELGRSVWKLPKQREENTKSPRFVNCLIRGGKAYVVVVHEWEWVFH